MDQKYSDIYSERIAQAFTSAGMSGNDPEFLEMIRDMWTRASDVRDFENALSEKAFEDDGLFMSAAFGTWAHEHFYYCAISEHMFVIMTRHAHNGVIQTGGYACDGGQCVINIDDTAAIGCPNGYGDGTFDYIVLEDCSEAEAALNRYFVDDLNKATFTIAPGHVGHVAAYDCAPFGESDPRPLGPGTYDMFGVCGDIYIVKL